MTYRDGKVYVTGSKSTQTPSSYGFLSVLDGTTYSSVTKTLDLNGYGVAVDAEGSAYTISMFRPDSNPDGQDIRVDFLPKSGPDQFVVFGNPDAIEVASGILTTPCNEVVAWGNSALAGTLSSSDIFLSTFEFEDSAGCPVYNLYIPLVKH
jgi:hypothetical protein